MIDTMKRLGLRFTLLALIMLLGLVSGFFTGAIHSTASANTNGPAVTPTPLPVIAVNPVPMNAMPAVNIANTQAGLIGVGANCGLVVPANPFSNVGLATPWQLVSGALQCHERDTANAVFLQATVFDPTAKQFFVYPPLVVDAGTLPASAPLIPQLPAGSIVGIWGGSNGGAVKLLGDGAGECINGTPDAFGQVFFCGADAFFAAVRAAGIQAPAIGIGSDGQPCPTIRSFTIVDQDQSDNVQTQYLVDATGRTAQDTAANRTSLDQVGIMVTANPSDNRVLTNYVDKALGCTPWLVPDIADGGNLVSSMALDEIQADQMQIAPQALIPAGDPMVLTAGLPNLTKINQYRLGADQPLATTLADASTAVYCVNILNAAPAKLLLDKTAFESTLSPVPTQGDNLYTFMAARLAVTLGPAPAGLGCMVLLGINNPVQMIVNGNGTVISATVFGK